MTLRSLRRRVIGAAMFSLLLVACAAPAAQRRAGGDQPGRPAAVLQVRAQAITVPDGTTVTWTNHDNFTHSVRLLDDGGDVMVMKPGESVSFTFHGVGEHHYDCSFHSQHMNGVVIVTAS